MMRAASTRAVGFGGAGCSVSGLPQPAAKTIAAMHTTSAMRSSLINPPRSRTHYEARRDAPWARLSTRFQSIGSALSAMHVAVDGEGLARDRARGIRCEEQRQRRNFRRLGKGFDGARRERARAFLVERAATRG